MTIDDHGRTEPPFTGDEYETLIGFLGFQRDTLEWKTRSLTDEQLRQTLPPSTMSLGGMLAHLAYVEDNWLAQHVGGSSNEPWASTDWQADYDADWHLVSTTSGDELRELWRASVNASCAVINHVTGELGRAAALDSSYEVWKGEELVSLRWILVHLIEEYARHNGHADLIRESIDGETGE
ncbi:DinB family protein [Gulosibacter sediminis]|uniref:DinB family protein n=1 Tax=Gulosibacter sediminis TaxID=1729695 RepID=UPI0024A82535|nr:DinB family protein [Gulosibacter sediminis]